MHRQNSFTFRGSCSNVCTSSAARVPSDPKLAFPSLSWNSPSCVAIMVAACAARSFQRQEEASQRDRRR